MKTNNPIVIKKLSLHELIAFEVHAQGRAYPRSPIRETEKQIDKRFAEQDRWRGILKRIRTELVRRTKEVI